MTVAPSGGERQEVTVQIGLVTWLRETSNGPVHVVRAPEVPSLNWRFSHRGDVQVRAGRVLVRAMRQWSLSAILACDGLGSSSPLIYLATYA